MGLHLFFLPNFPGATFIQGSTFISDSRVYTFRKNVKPLFNATVNLAYFLSFLCQDIISLGQVA